MTIKCSTQHWPIPTRSCGPIHPLVIDEIQAGGQRVVQAVKMASTPTTLRAASCSPGTSESLAGRAIILRLSALSQAELSGRPA